MIPPSIAGMTLHGSSYVPEDKLMVIGGAVYYHRRVSVRGRKRRPHGRTNGPRRWKVRVVIYQPALDALLAAESGTR